MTTDSADRTASLERLSALADGELDDTAVGHACGQWRGDAGLRSSWHAYQLIGDVLRSDDLGRAPAHDAAFLAALRIRLATEPVVLAPSPVAVSAGGGFGLDAAQRRPWSWRASTAVAAGFIAVAGVVFMIRGPVGGTTASPVLAQAGAATPAAVSADAGGSVPDPQALAARGKLIRDVRLDRYLAAHKAFAGSSALGVPSGYLRNATADAGDR